MPRTSIATSSGATPCRSSRTCLRCSRGSRRSTRWRERRSVWWWATIPRWPRALISSSPASSRSPSRLRSSLRGLGSLLGRLAAFAVDLDRDGHAGEHDDHDDQDVDAGKDCRKHTGEPIAAPGHGGDPADSSRDVVEEEAPVLHGAHPGQHGREGTDDRHEARDDDGLGPVLFVEAVGALDVLRIEEERLLAREDARPQAHTDGVAHAVPDDGRGDEQPVQPPDIQMARRREQARGDQERIAGEKAPDEQARLGKDDGHEENVAAPLDERVERVAAGENVDQEVHAGRTLADRDATVNEAWTAPGARGRRRRPGRGAWRGPARGRGAPCRNWCTGRVETAPRDAGPRG